jgi:hypothetical protein
MGIYDQVLKFPKCVAPKGFNWIISFLTEKKLGAILVQQCTENPTGTVVQHSSSNNLLPSHNLGGWRRSGTELLI